MLGNKGGKKHYRVGGTRGGQDQFKWEDVKLDRHRENYLGNSLSAPVGRWQKGKDLTWFTKTSQFEENKRLLEEERARMKALDDQLMDEAMGIKPKKYRYVEGQLESNDLKQLLAKGNIDRETIISTERQQGIGSAPMKFHETSDRVCTTSLSKEIQKLQSQLNPSKVNSDTTTTTTSTINTPSSSSSSASIHSISGGIQQQQQQQLSEEERAKIASRILDLEALKKKASESSTNNIVDNALQGSTSEQIADATNKDLDGSKRKQYEDDNSSSSSDRSDDSDGGKRKRHKKDKKHKKKHKKESFSSSSSSSKHEKKKSTKQQESSTSYQDEDRQNRSKHSSRYLEENKEEDRYDRNRRYHNASTKNYDY